MAVDSQVQTLRSRGYAAWSYSDCNRPASMAPTCPVHASRNRWRSLVYTAQDEPDEIAICIPNVVSARCCCCCCGLLCRSDPRWFAVVDVTAIAAVAPSSHLRRDHAECARSPHCCGC